MANIFLCVMFACMFAQYFYINLNVQILNNAVENLPVALIEYCVDLTEDYPFIDLEKLDQELDKYYAYCLKVPYHVDVNPSTPDEEINIGDPSKPTRVDITLTSSFSTFYTYSKTMFYEIVGGIYSD